MQVDEDVEVVLDVQQACAYRGAYEAVDEGARDRSISEGHRVIVVVVVVVRLTGGFVFVFLFPF